MSKALAETLQVAEELAQELAKAAALMESRANLAEHQGEPGKQEECLRRKARHLRFHDAVRDMIRRLKIKARASAFQPPTLEEAQAYGATLGMSAADVDSWWDHFAANGWKVSGKAPMRDWQAALRNGKRYADRKRPMPPSPPPSSSDPAGWAEFLKASHHADCEYRFAPAFMRAEFEQWRKK